MNPSAVIVRALRDSPSIAAVARRAGIPIRSVQAIVEGSVPSVDRANEICDALGLEFYIGPTRRDPVEAIGFSEPTPVPLAPGGMLPVADREIAAVIAVLADEYEEMDAPRRRGLLTRFWTFFPDLAERDRAGAGRRVAWLARD